MNSSPQSGLSESSTGVESAASAPADAPRYWGDWSNRGFRASVATVLLAVLIIVVGVMVRPPKVIITPGDATPVAPAISISGAPTYRNAGRVLFLTVYLSNHRPTLFELAAAELDGDAEIVDERKIFGPTNRKESDRIDQLLMTEAQAAAKTAALRRLGYTVPLTGSGAFVTSVLPTGPSAGKLQPRDVITEVNGNPVNTFDDLGKQFATIPAGATVDLRITRGTTLTNVSVTTAADANGKTIIGITGFTATPRYKYPVDITINPGDVSGPSAGLAFALGIVDDMTPGDLTGGKKIAVTGTIGPDGTVGAVGGVRQKTVTAKNAGAQLLLVPADEVEEAKSAGVEIRVIGVRTLDDALAALTSAGGAPIPNP